MHLASTTRGSFAVAALVIASATLAVVAASAPARPAPVRAHAAATCDQYADQAAAQRAADTRDPDGDGIYCESLPCPCPGPHAPSSPHAPAAPAPSPRSSSTYIERPETIGPSTRSASIGGASHSARPSISFRQR